MSQYEQNLIQEVINNSNSKNWKEAVLEWGVTDCREDESYSNSCICGKERLRYLFEITNNKNGIKLYPIGSSCIKKFKRKELNEVTTVSEKLFKLLHAIQNKSFISLNSEHFSRNLLAYLYRENVFKANKYNNFNPINDYEFLLKMFNQRNEPTNSQKKKINALIVVSIKPFLEEQLNNKIIKN